MTSVEVYHSQPLFPAITSSSVVRAATVVDTFNVLYPTGSILLCLKKVKGKNSAFYMCQVNSPLLAIKQHLLYVNM